MMNVGFDWREGLYGPKKAAAGTGQGTRERVYCKSGQHYAGPEDRVIWLSSPIGLSCEPCAQRVAPEAVAAERERVAAERAASKASRVAREQTPAAPGVPAPREGRKRGGHGTSYSYQVKKCRCDECVTAERRRRGYSGPVRKLEPSEWTHGIVSTYKNRGCRCDDCKRAEREHRKRRRTSPPPGAKPPEEWKHGTVHTYDRRGCRCDSCKAAKSEALRRQRQQRKRERLAAEAQS